MTPEEHARQWWGSDDYPHREDFDALVEQFRQARAEALEEAAVTAWSVGMQEFNRVAGLRLDAREVGSACAGAIRALKQPAEGEG